MANQHEALIRRGLEALAKGDLDAFLEVHAEDAVVHVPGRNRWAGEHRGHDAIRALYSGQSEVLVGDSELGAHDLLVNDQHAVLLQQFRGQREDGKSLQDNGVVVFHFEGDKVSSVWVHPQDQYANDEFWA